MIFVVTSPISHNAIRSYFSKLKCNESIFFLIYNYFDLISKDPIEKDNVFFVNSGDELDSYLLKMADLKDILINFDGFHIFSNAVIDLFGRRSANFHPSPLPGYGGINPISWGLLNGEQKWGYSWHRLSREIDCGALLFQEHFLLPNDATQIQIMRACIIGGIRHLDTIVSILQGVDGGDFIIPTIFSPSYYDGSTYPSISILSLSDLKKYERIIPFNPKKSWRWKINLEEIRVTAASLSSIFSSVQLKKTYELEGRTIYYAD